MYKRLLALLTVAAAMSIYGCGRPAGAPVGNMSDTSLGGSFRVPDWRV